MCAILPSRRTSLVALYTDQSCIGVVDQVILRYLKFLLVCMMKSMFEGHGTSNEPKRPAEFWSHVAVTLM